MMYEELIGELYLVASKAQSSSRRELLEKAADAIEELQQQVTALRRILAWAVEPPKEEKEHG